MSEENKWIFPFSNDDIIYGIADSGIEFFKGTPMKSLAREICQNSLDANLCDSEVVIMQKHH